MNIEKNLEELVAERDRIAQSLAKNSRQQLGTQVALNKISQLVDRAVQDIPDGEHQEFAKFLFSESNSLANVAASMAQIKGEAFALDSLKAAELQIDLFITTTSQIIETSGLILLEPNQAGSPQEELPIKSLFIEKSICPSKIRAAIDAVIKILEKSPFAAEKGITLFSEKAYEIVGDIENSLAQLSRG
jgi:hypothetical protein